MKTTKNLLERAGENACFLGGMIAIIGGMPFYPIFGGFGWGGAASCWAVGYVVTSPISVPLTLLGHGLCRLGERFHK